ncbi:AAEL004536-PA [Aedes aegypti]|uniref:AAEL004536-PA n=1 Tax=Aedes aegypti TaxID=7159 RepID=Q17CM6_AEDAE|nr:AAEL004536-PA [Aedes aegypti]
MPAVLVIVCGFLGITYAAKIKIPTKNRNDDLFSEDEFTFPVEDNKDPTNFTGDVMKAGILMAEIKNQGKGKFKYAVETQNGIEIEQIGKLRDDNKTLVWSWDRTLIPVPMESDTAFATLLTSLAITRSPSWTPGVVQAAPIKPFVFTTKATTTTTTTTTTEHPGYHYERPTNGYLPPTNGYLPPSNQYLPAKNVNDPPVNQLPPLLSPQYRGQNAL